MAQTQSRTVELNIKLQGVQNLEELELVTSEINDELKKIPLNSKAFDQMSNLALKAGSKLKEVDESIQGITSTEKAEAVLKLGQGLAGAFQLAQGASLLFGEKTSEQLTKVVAQVGGLMVAMDGAKKITEAFSAKNVAALKAVVTGFKESAIGAKLFGSATRTAIAATGIGLLVVILGTIVANWDKVKNAIINAFETLKDYIPLFKIISIAIDKIKEKFGNLQAFIAGVGAAIKAAFTFGESMNDAFNKAVTKSLELQSINKEILKITTENKKVMEDTNEVLAAQGDNQNEIYDNQINYNKELIKALEIKKQANDLSLEEQELLDESIQRNKVLYAQQKKLNTDQAKANYDKAKADKDRADAEQKRIEDEAKSLKALSEQRIKDERNYRNELADSKLVEESLNRENNILNLATAYEKLRLSVSEGGNVGLDFVETLRSALDLPEQISSNFWESMEKNGQLYWALNSSIIDDELLSIYYNTELLKIDKERNVAKTKDLTSQKELAIGKMVIFQIDNNILKLQEQTDDVTKQIRDNDLEIASLKNEELTLTNQIISLNNDQLAIQYETNAQIAQANVLFQEFVDKNKEVDVHGVKIISNYKKAQDAISKFKDENADMIQEVSDDLYAASHLVNQLLVLEITNLNKKADLEKKNLDEIQAKKQGYIDEDLRLQELLEDADGDRYDHIKEQIKANDALIQDSIQAEIDSKMEIWELEVKAAKARKTQSIIDAVIQGALGVVEALPNFILAALVAATTIASIATIKAQPLPEKPEMAEGGIVGGKSYSGDNVDAKLNSGEMVLNMKQQKNLFDMVNRPTPNVSNNYNSSIDYDRLGESVVVAMQKSPIYVSWTEWNNVNNRVKVTENRASLSKV